MDTRLYAWFAATWMVHLNGLSNLGNALKAGIVNYVRYVKLERDGENRRPPLPAGARKS